MIAELYDSKLQKTIIKSSEHLTLFQNSRSTCSDKYHFARPEIPANTTKKIAFEPLTYKILTAENPDSLLASVDATLITSKVKEDFIKIINKYDDKTQAGRIYLDKSFKFITVFKLIDLAIYLPELLEKEDRFLLFEEHLKKIEKLLLDNNRNDAIRAWSKLKVFLLDQKIKKDYLDKKILRDFIENIDVTLHPNE